MASAVEGTETQSIETTSWPTSSHCSRSGGDADDDLAPLGGAAAAPIVRVRTVGPTASQPCLDRGNQDEQDGEGALARVDAQLASRL
jgi:hypothetical protein